MKLCKIVSVFTRVSTGGTLLCVRYDNGDMPISKLNHLVKLLFVSLSLSCFSKTRPLSYILWSVLTCKDPAIVARSARTSDGVVARLVGLQLNREAGLTHVEHSPSKFTTAGPHSAPCSVSTGSNDSSPTANRIKAPCTGRTWRDDAENFVQGPADKDVFYIGSKYEQSVKLTIC